MREERAKRTIEAILAAAYPSSGKPRIVVLCYHSVHPTKQIRSATPAMFERQIEWLQAHCDIVPYASIPGIATGSSSGGRPVVAITFDDGYDDNHRFALPILLARGVPATVFVTTGLVNPDPDVVARFARAWSVTHDEVRGLTWSQVSEMHAGGFDVGAHTRTHPVLAQMADRDVREEIVRSKTTIEDHLGEAVSLFAYPFGKPREHFSKRTQEIVAELGFESAATILYRGVPDGADPMGIPRFPVTRDTMQIFVGKIAGRLDGIGVWQRHAPRRFVGSTILDGSTPPGTGIDGSTGIPAPTDSRSMESTQRPRPELVALPSARAPRWFLPRGPSRQAKAGLYVYHPVTIRSRLGWETTRVLAGWGAFRSFRSFNLMPREVWEAAAPYIPARGTLAVSRANHPGRFQALIFDAEGRPTTFVKVARDTMGSTALATERDSLERHAVHLQPPLMAPEVKAHSDGVLVFRAMDWRPRMYSWRLPEEVAYSLGDFFRRTSSDGSGHGVAHGDFAPWNLLWTDEGWGLVDWESCHLSAPPYFDLFHFLLQAHAGLRRPTLEAIREGTRGRGWIAGALRAYADASGVEVRDSAHHFREYLRIQADRIDPSVPLRVRRIRAKMSALLGP